MFCTEVMSWLDENESLHQENCELHDDFKRVFDFVKPFVTLSGGFSHNVQVFHDQYVGLVEKVAELELVSVGAGMVP